MIETLLNILAAGAIIYIVAFVVVFAIVIWFFIKVAKEVFADQDDLWSRTFRKK